MRLSRREQQLLSLVENNKKTQGPSNVPCGTLAKDQCDQIKYIEKNFSLKNVFLDIPYSNYEDCESILIKLLQDVGLSPVIAKERLTSNALLCKVCRLIKTCKYGIADISSRSNSVSYEYGLMHGYGMKVCLAIRKDSEKFSDILGIEHMPYIGQRSFKIAIAKWLIGNIDECDKQIAMKIVKDEEELLKTDGEIALVELLSDNLNIGPVSVNIIKQYIADDKYRIQLHDYIYNETEKLYSVLSPEKFKTTGEALDAKYFQKRLKDYEGLIKKLLEIMACLAYYDDGRYSNYFKHVIERISKIQVSVGYDILIRLQYYPALLLFYTAGIIALSTNNYKNLATIMTSTLFSDNTSKNKPSIMRLNVSYVFGLAKELFPRPNEYTPGSNHIYQYIYDFIRPYIPDEEKYADIFDVFEYLSGLTYMDLTGRMDWAPIGRFHWKREMREGIPPYEKYLTDGLAKERDWELLKAGYFKGSTEQIQSVKLKYDQFLSKVVWR
jgi:hypothetical protein